MTLIHRTWMDLKPNENMEGNPEVFNDYYARMSTRFEYENIPKEVFKQWIYPHHGNPRTLNNYSWIDYESVEFELVEWDYELLKDLYVIEKYRTLTDLRGNYNDFNDFCCIEKDLKYWKEKGTWRTPSIILDVRSLNENYPEWSELHGYYQLVEGHSRFGYLNSMKRICDIGKGNITEKHKIYLMKNVRMYSKSLIS
ncbi:hypothetical protein [Ancylomarina sp. 16SWW S1-10-2]|uniref:hypothetical protein n=1 Tax=Ancylomarina sp. 16SWW S1-10-2 TaxID=2499681 RepID=UPI0012ADBC75|nr:hypothetical protein [Ancylomarina sp. 16SWW S1-10-2]MRT93568.1 hypothetical protein [Ancylomarina sp. 16SWW S1-10-2]